MTDPAALSTESRAVTPTTRPTCSVSRRLPSEARWTPASGGRTRPARRCSYAHRKLGLRFLRFNTARGAFTDARLRRGVNYAIDRRALAAVLGERPSDSYLPPALPSSDRSSVYPLSPNASRARALLRGFRGTVVLYTCTDPDCTATARILHANLAALGIPVKIEQFDDPFGEALKPGAAYDILLTTWFFDWADPSNFLNLLLDPTASARTGRRLRSRFRRHTAAS